MTEPHIPLSAALADRYRIERELGRGGMAIVYLARDVHHDRSVALKVLHQELAATLGPERFLHEIRTTARLQHPHILPVFDSGEAGGRLWYTMPFVEGESLREKLRREIQLSVAEAIRITREVALALDSAHRHGVVHRDIKPENILLSEGQALVADFGVARAIQEGTEGRLTETGLTIGTLAYMSPEQAAGARHLDGRADVYSLGCVLYELLAGEPPFTGRTPQAIIAKHVLEPVPHVRTLRESVPDAVEQVLSRALAKTPADRFATAGEFAQALSQVAAEAAAPPSAHPLRDATRARLLKRVFAGGIAILLALAAGAVATLWRPGAAPTSLDTNLLVVAPFDVLDQELALWREGMVDLLARTFDGAGSLRTVPPATAVRRWRGRAEPVSVGEFARGFGAQLAVFGTVIPAGGDSVRLRAGLLDVRGGRLIAEVEVPGSAEDMAPLADSVAIRLLRGLSVQRPVGAVRSASLGARSMPAVKAFLQGEQFYRRGDWESAIEAYRRATELDTTFALAYYHRADAEGWYNGAGDTLSNTFYLRAAALNHGLSPRESLLIVADSLQAAVNLEFDDPGTWRRLTRQRGLLMAAVRQYPTDAESWFQLADAQIHNATGPGLGTQPEEVANNLDRALVADPSFAPAYYHRIELAFRLDGPAAARSLVDRYLSLRPSTVDAQALRLVQAMLDSSHARRPKAQQELDTLDWEVLWTAFELTQYWSDSLVLDLLRAMARPRVGVSRRGPGTRFLPSIALSMRGHIREALQAQSVHESVVALAGQLGILPEDSVRATIGRSPHLPWSYGWWLSADHDAATLQTLVRAADSIAQIPGEGADRRRSATLGRQAARAFLALARADTAGALRALSAISDTLLPGAMLRLLKAQLLGARGQDHEAARVLDEAQRLGLIVLPLVFIELERARIAERLNDRPRAMEGYRFVVGMWAQADPELQPFVAEAREALRRLSGEVRR